MIHGALENEDSELSASMARAMVPENRSGVDINYTLTMRRVYRLIRSLARQGYNELNFTAPSLVLDGSCTDPIVLAKAIKRTLVAKGFVVMRNEDKLHVSWKS